MLNHTYTSVKNANLVDCGKKQHIPSQPSTLLRDNYLGEYRTELDKKKVLANLGIATDLSLEWANIKGNIGDNKDLIGELNARTTYVTKIGDFKDRVISIIDGIKYLETIVGGEQEGEEEQNQRLTDLETLTDELIIDLEEVKEYLTETIEVNIDKLEKDLGAITEKVNNITDLIQVSSKSGNALRLVGEDELEEGETPGLYVPDLSSEVSTITDNVTTLQTNVKSILDTYVTKDQLGGGDFDFVSQDDFEAYTDVTDEEIADIKEDLKNTVKTGEDGHVDTLYVNKISKNNDDGNIVITDSLEVSSGIPLDVRFVKENLEELYALPVKVCYPGMGVIVNSLSALYILRKPGEGVTFNQDYISNPHNWKCPEDLVTVALTRDEYEDLPEKNEHVFYYIYEEEPPRTQEPKREDFDSEDEFKIAWQEWVDSLKILSQDYMSASWGVTIEKALSGKASMDSVSALAKEIASIKGDDSGTSLDSLSADISELQSQNEFLETRIDDILIIEDEVEKGRLVDVEDRVTTIETNLENYVTEEELAELSGDFNFVKPEDYEADKKAFSDALSEKVITKVIELNGSLVDVKEGVLHVDSEAIAKSSEVPVIEIMTQSEYDKLESKDADTYYYTYDEETIYVTQVELNQKLKSMQDQINALSQTISTLEKAIEDLQALHPQDEENA